MAIRISKSTRAPKPLTPDEQLKQLIDDFYDIAFVWYTWRRAFWPRPPTKNPSLAVVNDFMRATSDSMIAFVIIGLVKLTDKTRGTLVVSRVLKAHDIKRTDVSAAVALKAAGNVESACATLAREHRHTYVAHNNIDVATRRYRREHRPSVPAGLIQHAFDQFVELLKELERLRLPGHTTYFEASERLGSGAAEQLLSLISQRQTAK